MDSKLKDTYFHKDNNMIFQSKNYTFFYVSGHCEPQQIVKTVVKVMPEDKIRIEVPSTSTVSLNRSNR